jgi:ABC-type histidine transport system ATPase subunit
VVPDVHFGIIENVFEIAIVPANIRMIQMSAGNTDKMYDKNVCKVYSTNQHNRDVQQRSIDNRIHPIVSEMSGKTHFLHTVMNFMHFPQKGNIMQQTMHVPLQEIANQEKQQ